MTSSERIAAKASKFAGSFRLVALVLTFGFVLGLNQASLAVDEGDQLIYGQELVDTATVEIDKRVSTLIGGPMSSEVVYNGIASLLDWWNGYRQDKIALQYHLDEPIGILIQDGVSDTLATRLSPLLEKYAKQNPEENLSRGRQTLEILLSHPNYQPPTGRLIGYYVDGFSALYFAQAETLLVKLGEDDRVRTDKSEAIEGVYDGVLRHLLDLTRLYDQVHSDDTEKYFSRLDQEDSIPQRSRCTKCGHQGLKVTNIMNGLKEADTPECTEEELRKHGTGVDGINARFDCRFWGHIFDLECTECGEEYNYAVPLPFFKRMQRAVATGKIKTPDMSPRIKKL